MIFIADLFPLRRDTCSNKQVSDDDLIVACKKEGIALITDRKDENMEYFCRWQLQSVFTKVWSQRHRPCEVDLLINKVDLLRGAVKAGLQLPNSDGPEQFAVKTYASLVNLLRKNCEQIGIKNFECEAISFKEDSQRLQEILKRILQRLAERNQR